MEGNIILPPPLGVDKEEVRRGMGCLEGNRVSGEE